jgi:hypothetical protein
MTFVEGKYIFRIDHVPSADEYLVDVVRRRSSKEKSGVDAAAAIARVVARRAKRSNLWTGAGATERAMLSLYNLARNSLGASTAGNVTNLSRAFVRYVRDKGSSVGIAAVALSDRCRQAWLGEVASPGQQAVAAALVSFLTPQNVAPVLVSRLRRETVRISEHFRLELLKPISASPFGLWQPDMFGEPQLDIGRLLT